jgi:hypothetical protein
LATAPRQTPLDANTPLPSTQNNPKTNPPKSIPNPKTNQAITGARCIFQRMTTYARYTVAMTFRVCLTFGLLTVAYNWVRDLGGG